MKHIRVYGIRNCDTIKKTLVWLSDRQIDYLFHDYKKEGISEEKLRHWTEQVHWETLINKKGTTWKKLDESIKERITDKEAAMELMNNQTSLIRRPVIERDGEIVAIGFAPDDLEKRLL